MRPWYRRTCCFLIQALRILRSVLPALIKSLLDGILEKLFDDVAGSISLSLANDIVPPLRAVRSALTLFRAGALATDDRRAGIVVPLPP